MKIHLYYKNIEQDFNKNYMREMNELGITNLMNTKVSTIFLKGTGNPKSPIIVRIDSVDGIPFDEFISKQRWQIKN